MLKKDPKELVQSYQELSGILHTMRGHLLIIIQTGDQEGGNAGQKEYCSLLIFTVTKCDNKEASIFYFNLLGSDFLVA